MKKLLFFFSLLLAASPARAALLYLTPDKGSYQPGDTFGVEARIDPAGECVNAIEATLTYPRDAVQVVDVDRSGSIFPLWVRPPDVNGDAGTVTFVAGIPGGYCGRIPGDPDVSNVIAKIIFRVPGFRVGEAQKDSARLAFSDFSQVLLSDGRATKANLEFAEAVFSIADLGQPNTREWLDALRQDTVPPEPFAVELVGNASLFAGKHAIVFTTLDKQTGIDHFEVLEADAQGNIAGTFKKASWKAAQSPYLLEDQELGSIVTVKAIDKAGNERLFEFQPPGYAPRAPKKPLPWKWMGSGAIAALAMALAGALMVKRRRRLRASAL